MFYTNKSPRLRRRGGSSTEQQFNRVSRKTDSIHHRHPERVVYRSCCLNYGTVAVSKVTSRRSWCIESLFPVIDSNSNSEDSNSNSENSDNSRGRSHGHSHGHGYSHSHSRSRSHSQSRSHIVIVTVTVTVVVVVIVIVLVIVIVIKNNSFQASLFPAILRRKVLSSP